MSEDVLQPTEKLESGMTISKDVLGPGGVPLIKEGEEITDDIINWLKRLDIKEVWVRKGKKGEPALEDLQSLQSALDQRFSKTIGDPIMEEIKESIFRFLAAKEG